MKVEEELHESLKRISKIQQGIASKADGLDKQMELLEKRIGKMVKELGDGSNKEKRVELLAELCLYSELGSVLGFDQMITAREKFQELLPRHFNEYLSHLDSISWEISWSGCLDCRHFLGRCNLGLTPSELESDEYGLEKTCPKREKRSRKV